jgi:hypothetical protein
VEPEKGGDVERAGGGATPPGPTPPKDEAALDEDLLRRIAARVVSMGLSVPAVFFLESSKPLSFLGSQALVFFEPFVKVFLNTSSYDRFTNLMEDRSNVERLIRLIEEIEDDRARAERGDKQARREAKLTARKARGEEGEKRRWWFRRRS